MIAAERREPGEDWGEEDREDGTYAPDPEPESATDLDAWRAIVSAPARPQVQRTARPLRPPAAVRGEVVTVPDDYQTGHGHVQVAIVNAQSVATGCPAPGYDRPFRVTAWELRMARAGASLSVLGRDCHRLARTTGVSPPRWMDRVVGELLARRVTSADLACQIATWHRQHARLRVPTDSPVAWRDRESLPAEEDVVELSTGDAMITLTPAMRVAAAK